MSFLNAVNRSRARILRWMVAIVVILGLWARITTHIVSPIFLPLPGSNATTSLETLIHNLYWPRLQNITAPLILGDVHYELKKQQQYWKMPLREQLCILDVDTRPMNRPNQVWSHGLLNWTEVKGSTAGFVNHYLYTKVHGYRYQFIQATEYPNRVAAWARIPAIISALEHCQVVVYMDSDAIFPHLHLPMEWLLNYWNITEDIAMSMAQEAVDWHQKHWNLTREDIMTMYSEPFLSWVSGLDSRGQTALNAGFMIIQNTPQTRELLYRWANCPTCAKYPGCSNLTSNWPAEQGAFNEYIRYDFPHRVREIPCNEAHGYPGISIGCYGTLIRHYTLDKEGVQGAVEDATLTHGVMEMAQRSMVQDKADLFTKLASTNFSPT